MSIGNEAIPGAAIEAAARALRRAAINDQVTAFPISFHERHATAALTAAAPHIQAAALRYAGDAADDPSPDEMDFYQIDQAQVGNWLRARADQLEGKSE